MHATQSSNTVHDNTSLRQTIWPINDNHVVKLCQVINHLTYHLVPILGGPALV